MKQCLQENTIELFQDSFKISNYRYQTRNNAKMLKLPVIKIEYARKSFYFTGTNIYNTLPLVREIENINKFKRFVEHHLPISCFY